MRMYFWHSNGILCICMDIRVFVVWRVNILKDGDWPGQISNCPWKVMNKFNGDSYDLLIKFPFIYMESYIQRVGTFNICMFAACIQFPLTQYSIAQFSPFEDASMVSIFNSHYRCAGIISCLGETIISWAGIFCQALTYFSGNIY